MNNFNFDLERMQKAVEGDSIRIPNGMRGAELKASLSNLQRDREEALAKPTDISVEEAFDELSKDD